MTWYAGMLICVRTTLNIPDELYRDVRVRAAQDGRTVTSLVEEALRAALAEHQEPRAPFVLRALPLREGDADDVPAPPFDTCDNSAVRDYLDEVARRSGDESYH